MPTTWNLRLQTAARIKPVKPKTLCVSRGNASRSTFFRWPNFLFHASNNHQIAIAPRRNQRRTLIIMIIMKIIKMFSSFALGSRKEHRWRQIIANDIVYQSFLLFWGEKNSLRRAVCIIFHIFRQTPEQKRGRHSEVQECVFAAS